MAPGRRSRTVVATVAAAVVVVATLSGCSRGRHKESPASASNPSRAVPTGSSGRAPAGSQASSGRAPSTPGASSSADGASAATSAAPCPVPLKATVGRTDGALPAAAGPARRYVLYLPESYDGRTRLPVVFDFHGYGANADEQLLYSGFMSLAERNQFAVVALNGQGDPPHYNQRPVATGGEASDIVVVGKLLDTLMQKLCLDPRRVYAAGMSDGGVLAAALGCFASSRFAAVAAVAALIYDSACDKGGPIPFMAFRGTADPIVPYEGGKVTCCGGPVVQSTKDDIASWAKHNGCRPVPAVKRSGQVETSTYGGCKGRADVVLHTIVGGGHTWPGAIAVPGLGVTTRDINASQSIWEFFAAHPRI